MSDKNATKQDMYDDVDPFWLVDYHVMKVIAKLIPFEHLPIKGMIIKWLFIMEVVFQFLIGSMT